MASVDDFNFRHLRVFTEICKVGSFSKAAKRIHLSQPAMTHAISKLENILNTKLFERGQKGVSQTQSGKLFYNRTKRALSLLNENLRSGTSILHPIELRVSHAQLRSLMAVESTGSYSAAARQLNQSQPTVFRAVKNLADTLGLKLVTKTEDVLHLSRAGKQIVKNTKLATAELQQAIQEISVPLGIGFPQVRIGALPLARAAILPKVIHSFCKEHKTASIYVDDGPYEDLLKALRMGTLDLLVGALRQPSPSKEVVQTMLFTDRLGVYCGRDHPLLCEDHVSFSALGYYPWVLPRNGTPTRKFFNDSLAPRLSQTSFPPVETSSMILVRELLQTHNRLTLISNSQAAKEVQLGLLFRLPISLNDPPRQIGYTHRKNWYPTLHQQMFIKALTNECA